MKYILQQDAPGYYNLLDADTRKLGATNVTEEEARELVAQGLARFDSAEQGS